MTEFWKASAVVILTVILGTAIGKTEKDLALVLTAVACCVVILTALRHLSEVLAFLWELNSAAEYGNTFWEPLLRISGIALLAEMISLICTDAGNSSLGKAMQILGNSVILVQSIPVFESFFSIVQEIMNIA